MQLGNIENIMKKKIWETKKFEPDGANSHRFEIGSICNAYYTINIFIQFFKEVYPKIYVLGCTTIKQPSIYP
jgi:hypothetical protein